MPISPLVAIAEQAVDWWARVVGGGGFVLAIFSIWLNVHKIRLNKARVSVEAQIVRGTALVAGRPATPVLRFWVTNTGRRPVTIVGAVSLCRGGERELVRVTGGLPKTLAETEFCTLQLVAFRRLLEKDLKYVGMRDSKNGVWKLPRKTLRELQKHVNAEPDPAA